MKKSAMVAFVAVWMAAFWLCGGFAFGAERIVVNSSGGYVWVYEALGKKYAREGAQLEVAYCASACVLMLDLVGRENVCFRRTAWIGYHGDNHVTGPEPAHLMRWERGTDWIKRGYREC